MAPKRHWNYRLIRKPSADPDAPHFFELHEVHWEGDKPIMYSSDPCTFCGDSAVEVAGALSMALKDAICEPWIDIEAFPK